MNLSKNKKLFYNSANFKIDVLNILLNSILYDKIALEISVFDEKVYQIVLESLFCKSKIIESTDELKFKENYKNKNFKVKIENNNIFENFDDDEIMNFDKCIICDEFFSKEKVSKIKKENNFEINNNINSSSSEDQENLFNFNSENVDINSNLALNNNNTNKNSNNLSEKITRVQCPNCKNELHTICFAEILLEDSNDLIPKEGGCLVCSKEYKWSEFLKN